VPDRERVADPATTGRTGPRGFGVVSAVALVVIAAVALSIGSGVGRSSTPSVVVRAASLESQIRCPQCEDISVAQSQASSAIQARRQITSMLAAGSTDAQIEQSFVDRYGPSILLSPPASGLGALVWILPSVGAVLAIGAIGVLFWRRQRALSRLRAGS
jgi:cytochrome c-type biogenesis protein CcmH